MTRRQEDQRAIRVAQAAAIVAAAGAVVLAVGPISNFLAPQVPSTSTARSAGTDASVAVPGGRVVTTASAADALSLANPRTLRPAPDKPVVEPDPIPTDTAIADIDEPAIDESAGPTGEWLYIGSIVSAKNSYAWFTIDGVQFLLARGASRDGRVLSEVHADHVVLAFDDGSSERIDLLPPNRAWPEPGMRAASEPDPNSPLGRAAAARASAGGTGRQANTVRARGPRSSDVYREQINRSRAASLPPGRSAPGSPSANALAAADPRFSQNNGSPGNFPADLDPVEFSEFITKVSLQDYDPQWAREIIERAGIALDDPINVQISRLADLGVTIESNPDFFNNLGDLTERIIDIEPDPITQEKLKAILEEQRLRTEQQGEDLDEETRKKLEEIRNSNKE